MKVDSKKSDNPTTKENVTRISPKVEQNSNLTQNTLVSNPNQSKKDFAAILQNGNEQNDFIKENKKTDKTKDNSKLEDQNNVTKADHKEKEVRKETREKSNSGDQNDAENDKGFGHIQLQNQQTIDELNIPNGRSIIHVADLERIISKIRSQTIANKKQVTLELNRSVFDGLKLKIIIEKNKGVTAEFLAANENVKSQLTARSDELADLLKNRGVKLEKLQMSLDSENEDQNEKETPKNEIINNLKTETNSQSNTKPITNTFVDSDTFYQA